MAEMHAETHAPHSIVTSPIADADLKAAVEQVIIDYPPAIHDRHRIHIIVHNGEVALKGNVKSAITRKYLLEHVARVGGVTLVDFSGLYDDDTIRLDVGQVVPHGVFVNVIYGAAVLSGTPPTDMSVEELVRKVGTVSGVQRVVTSFIITSAG